MNNLFTFNALDNFLNIMYQRVVFLNEFGYFFMRENDGGVIFPAKLVYDIGEGRFCLFAENIHGDLPGK